MDRSDWHDLTPRESEVLAAVERRLSNAEIAETFHLSVRTVESHIAALRRKLGVDSRSKLITAAHGRRGATVAVPPNSFVGRVDDLDAVRTLLDRVRWVTVVGPAGCGKTRLALELAAAHLRAPVVADLEHATPADVVTAVATAIGLGADSAANLVSACAVALSAERYLLVLDNCDRVSAAAAEVIGQLSASVGSLTVLATSRSPIGGAGEVIYELPPLAVEDGTDSGAVRLFLDRAGSAAPGTRLSATDSEVVAQICRRLDGLPLAIELAAARVRHLPVTELASRLQDGFEPLVRAGPVGRHRTLEAAFDWTWDLLDGDERSVLSRLAALPGTFDLELAEGAAMPGAGGVVLRLLDRSLVSPAATVSEPRRFRLLGSLRAFVLDRTDAATVQEVRRAHAGFQAGLISALSARARTDDSRTAAEQARHLAPEVSAAIGWAVAEQPELALRLARALAVVAEQYGPQIDSLDAIGRAARDPAVRAVARPPDLLEIGLALCYGDLDLVADLALRALDTAADATDQLAAHHLAGYVDTYRHASQQALGHLEVAERLADDQLAMWQLASVRQAKGMALRDLGELTAGLAAFESAMRTYALVGDAMHVNNTRYMMAATSVGTDDHREQAVVWAEQCAAYAAATGNAHELAHARLTLARLTTGRHAEPDLLDAVDTFRAVGDLRCLTRSYLRLADGLPPAEQVTFLEQAVHVAASARDAAHQTTALEQLVRARWQLGDRHQAATTLGALVSLVGYDDATSRCPEAMVGELDDLRMAIAEGQARSTG
jgi:predicted ATPase/DNA-binding CsgD family transcriptional regulator